jgi:TPR repeat protein
MVLSKNDLNEAVRWYRKAAEQGYARGQAALGSMYSNGTGVKQDDEEATKWYKMAAKMEFKKL